MGRSVTRYPFKVPEWCRTIYVSADAKTVWEPRIRRIGDVWSAAERASVGRFRQAARQNVSPEGLPALSTLAAQAGLHLVTLGQVGASSGYQAGPLAVQAGQRWDYQVALTASPAVSRAFLAAYAAGDDVIIGDLLGFPPCCIKFFEQTWKAEKWIDTTWPMSAEHDNELRGHNEFARTVSALSTNNILLRWLGVRWVPHLPCSFACEGTRVLGNEFQRLVHELDPQAYEWMVDLLESPVEWSALGGIAEIRHPLLKISTKTDATAERLIVQRNGRKFPEGAVRGVQFPYNVKTAVVSPLTFHPPAKPVVDEHLWKDNGFSSFEAMDAVHATIVKYFGQHTPKGCASKVIDLGSGNGRLLAALTKDGVGIEIDAARASRAVSGATVLHQSISDFLATPLAKLRVDVVLLMPGRLAEMAPTEAETLRRWLYTTPDRVLLYAYGDVLSQRGDLYQFASSVGLVVENVLHEDGVQIGVLRR